MIDLIVLVLREYFPKQFAGMSDIDLQRVVKGFAVVRWSKSGAMVELPRHPALTFSAVPPKRVNTGLLAQINGGHIADILVFIEEGHIATIELASPFDDLPEEVHKFIFVEHPKS